MQAQSDTWGKKDHDFLYRMIMMTLIVSFHNNKKKKEKVLKYDIHSLF